VIGAEVGSVVLIVRGATFGVVAGAVAFTCLHGARGTFHRAVHSPVTHRRIEVADHSQALPGRTQFCFGDGRTHGNQCSVVRVGASIGMPASQSQRQPRT